MANLYIVELPENLGVLGDIKRVGATRADSESEAVRNYLFGNLPERDAKIAAARISRNGGYEKRAHLVPDFESEGMDIHEIRQARPFVFAMELAGGETPDSVYIAKARWLMRQAGFAAN